MSKIIESLDEKCWECKHRTLEEHMGDALYGEPLIDSYCDRLESYLKGGESKDCDKDSLFIKWLDKIIDELDAQEVHTWPSIERHYHYGAIECLKMVKDKTLELGLAPKDCPLPDKEETQ